MDNPHRNWKYRAVQYLLGQNDSLPAVPESLHATADSDAVYLDWAHTVRARGYNVKWSPVSGGPYSTVASPATPGACDNDPYAGGTIYYVVSAFNDVGESANSEEVAVNLLAMEERPPNTNASHRPGRIQLSCYPNPFNSAVSIRTVPGAAIAIYDIQGRIVESGIAKSGEFVWEAGAEVSAGVYLVRARLGDEVSVTKRVVYLK